MPTLTPPPPIPSALGTITSGQLKNVRAFGATGNGTTDDTTALQNAFNDAADLLVPAGTYLLATENTFGNTGYTVTAALGLTVAKRVIVAKGAIFKCTNSAGYAIYATTGNSEDSGYMTPESMELDGLRLEVTQVATSGIMVRDSECPKFTNCEIWSSATDSTGDGVTWETSGNVSDNGQLEGISAERIFVRGFANHHHFTNNGGTGSFDQAHFQDCTSNLNNASGTNNGYLMDSGTDFARAQFDNCGGWVALGLSGNLIEDNHSGAFLVAIDPWLEAQGGASGTTGYVFARTASGAANIKAIFPLPYSGASLSSGSVNLYLDSPDADGTPGSTFKEVVTFTAGISQPRTMYDSGIVNEYTTSTSLVSAGLGVAFTPATTEAVVQATLNMFNSTAGDGVKAAIYRNTTGIPALGTAVGSDHAVYTGSPLTSTASDQFCVSAPLALDTGLTAGTTYYYYVAFEAVTGGTATMNHAAILLTST